MELLLSNESMCKGNIMLEPRLQEYLKKREYYQKHNIAPCIAPEEEFSITFEDKKRINAFLGGDNDIYNRKTQRRFEDMYSKDNDPDNFFFPSRELKNDPRFDRLKKKMARDKEAIKQRHNYSNYQFNPTIGGGGALSGDCRNDKFLNKNNEMDEDSMDAGSGVDGLGDKLFLDSRDFSFENEHSFKFRPNKDIRRYNHPPKIRYNDVVPYENLTPNYDTANKSGNELPHDNNIDDIIGKLDSYTDHVNTTYQQSSEMDIENKIVIPVVNCKDKKSSGNATRYQAVPFMGKKGLRDINAESFVKCGIPSTDTKRKSYGYSNPAEHYFDYISDDIQQANHSVLPFPRGGVATRNDNRKTARPYVREILN